MLFKREKQEKIVLNLHYRENRKIAVNAALNNGVPLINKGDGIFVLDLKKPKMDMLSNFFKQLMSESQNKIEGVVVSDDPECVYIILFDVKED